MSEGFYSYSSFQKLSKLASKKAIQGLKKRIRVTPKFQKSFHKKVVKRYTKKLSFFIKKNKK